MIAGAMLAFFVSGIVVGVMWRHVWDDDLVPLGRWIACLTGHHEWMYDDPNAFGDDYGDERVCAHCDRLQVFMPEGWILSHTEQAKP